MKRFLATLILAVSILGCSSAVAPTAPVSAQPVVVAQRGNPNVTVWVNTNSGVYHCPGTRWYGTTKRGKYMKQKDAQAAGYRPAYGAYCG